MPPTDMPDVTIDVANVLASHIPCVTGDVEYDQPSHTLAGGVINTNPSHANSIFVGGSDATGDVVNVQPSHISAGDDRMWTRISKSELSLLKKDAKIGKLVRRRFAQKRYTNTPLSRRLLAIALMHASKLGLETAANMTPLIIASFLTECDLDLEDVATSSPSATTLKRIMIDEAVDTIYTERRDMKGLPLTLLADKGDGQSKRGTASFIKLAARMDESRNRVKVTCIGIQGAGDSSIDAATAIDHALKVYDYPDSRVLFSGHGTDAGGGGTREDLLQKLIAVNRVRNSIAYIWTTCALHGLNLCLSSPTTRTMGEGGLLKRTVLQLLHSAYNLSQQYNYSEWADIWTLLTGAKSENVKCPVMTRWECVGEAVENMVKNCEEWKVVANNIVNTEKSGSTKHTIASHLSSLLCEKVLIAHLYFLRAYGNSWWLPHFQWQKHIDERSKSAGFLGRHMALHFYVQHRDLYFLINNWKTHDKFKEYVRTFPNNSIEYNMDKLANDFFKRVDAIHTKHFSQWRDKYLHLALAGDVIPARYLANWILGLPNPSLPLQYFLTVHKTTIDVEAALSFLTLNNSPETQRSNQYFLNHRDAIIEIAEGKELWSEDSDCMRKFRQYVKNNWLIVSTNTQLVERWVKDSNECTLSGKDEHFSSIIATCRSATIFDYKLDARTEAEGRELKGNQFVVKGIKGQRINRKTGRIEERTSSLIDIRGSSYAALVIRKTIARSITLEECKDEDAMKIIYDALVSKTDQHRLKRNETTVENYSQVLLSPTPAKPLNTIQRSKGVDTTSHMKGEIAYSSLCIVHIPLVREEMTFRGVQYDDKMSIKALVKALMEHDIAAQKETNDITANEINNKTFTPLRRSAEAYDSQSVGAVVQD